MPGREQVLRTLARALRPGGWLPVEDFDIATQPLACPEERDPAQALANRVRAGFVALLELRGIDRGFGRALPRLLREAGLVDVRADAAYPVIDPAAAVLETANTRQVREGLVAHGHASDDEIDAHLAALAAGDLDVTSPPLVGAWGRRAGRA